MHRFKEALHIAGTNLTTNAIRSILSVLGIVIGIAAVIVVLSIGTGAKKQILDSINAFGANVFYVQGRYDETTSRIGQLEQADILTLEQLPNVVTALPQLNLYQSVRSRNTDTRAFVNGVSASYLDSKQAVLIAGRGFSPIEMEERNLVCVINKAAAIAFFPEGDAIGDTLFIEKIPWTVIGVYSRANVGSKKRNADSKEIEILAPTPALLRNIPSISFQSIEVRVQSNQGKQTEQALIEAMERGDPNRKGLFQIQDVRKYYTRTLELQKMMSLIGVIVAGISLIVGGIGMMNVMLTSVAERTREIGIRRAVGARKKDILAQFLVESCVLSGLGGILGLMLGAALGRALPLLFKDSMNVAPQLQPSFLVLSVGIGVVLGVAFGFYPAVKASRLSPAEALRTE